MTAPNRSTLWGETLVDELVAAGVETACIAPGSRSTPLTVAFAERDDVTVCSHLDERSAAFFALGRSRRSGDPTALVCTSGTAAANFHPAVIEAFQSRVPLVVCTADRPPELQDSGANQTIDQTDLYGDAVRYSRQLPEASTEPRTVRSLRVTVDRAVAAATGTPPGPAHLNVPLTKPLEPTDDGTVPADLADRVPLGTGGRDGPFVRTTRGRPTLDDGALATVRDALDATERGLLVAGPANAPVPSQESLARLARASGFPVLADPLSGHRFGGAVEVCGGFDSYLDATLPDPEVVVRFGASPTSKVLRQSLRDADARQFVVDPAGEWREATFTATDRLVTDPTWLAQHLADALGGADAHGDSGERTDWARRFAAAERAHWGVVEEAVGETFFEGAILATAVRVAPDPATLVVSNSMPVRDLDRFGQPRAADLTVLGNRGASGIDGITSTALGAGSATSDPLIAVLGDLACYHDTNGLLAVERCGVDATLVVINNDGGGIFHMLPIESFDPPFTEQFRTPHGLSFGPVATLHGLEYVAVDDLGGFETAYRASLDSPGSQLIEVRIDAETSHRHRERLHERVLDRVA